VVRLAGKRVKKKPQYFLLGDDIVINGKEVAQEYKNIITSLGVTINFSKSISGNSAEFAKRLLTQGREVSPVPAKFVKTMCNDNIIVHDLLHHLVDRSYDKQVVINSAEMYVSALQAMVRKEGDNTLHIVASNPLKRVFGPERPSGIPEGNVHLVASHWRKACHWTGEIPTNP
jgi:hypothetical protein